MERLVAERLNWHTESVVAIPFCEKFPMKKPEFCPYIYIYIYFGWWFQVFYFYIFSLFGEMIQFDLRVFFQMGW